MIHNEVYNFYNFSYLHYFIFVVVVDSITIIPIIIKDTISWIYNNICIICLCGMLIFNDLLTFNTITNNPQNKSFPNAALIDELLAPNNTTYNTSLNTTLNNTFNTTFNTNTTFNNTQQQLQLDDIVVRLSRDMIDDYPSADPSTSKHKSGRAVSNI